ncbi:MAG: glycosyltransferase family 4 protein [Leptolyngbyaceae cyanobacterium]
MMTSKTPINLSETEDLRQSFGISDPVIMYVGNLESYQGIDLLLDGFARLMSDPQHRASLVIVGGDRSSISQYSAMAAQLDIADAVYMVGPRPVEKLSEYLAQADILVSPRLKGVNTPMKLFSYLKSGKPTVVTNLITHTQVVDENTALLVEPDAESMAAGLQTLLADKALSQRLGRAGQQLVEASYSQDAFRRTFNSVMSWLESELQDSRGQQELAI